MTLVDIIKEAENGSFDSLSSIDLHLGMQIVEEIAAAKKSTERARLWGDAKILADHIIEKYLDIEQSDRQKMAEIYERESGEVSGSRGRKRKGAFQGISGIRHLTRVSLQNELDNLKITLLNQIVNYAHIVPILERYCCFVDGLENPMFSQTALSRFLISNNLTKVLNYDFKSERQWKVCNATLRFESLTYGVPDQLKKKVKAARTLLKERRKAVESYIAWAGEKDMPGINDIKFDTFLRANGWAHFTYREYLSGKELRKGKRKNEKELRAAMTQGMDCETIDRLEAAATLKKYRAELVMDYIKHFSSLTKPIPRNSSFTQFCRVKGVFKSWCSYDFENEISLRLVTMDKAFRSITFDLADDLVTQADNCRTLLDHRIRVLTKYISMNEQTNNMPQAISLYKFMRSEGLQSWWNYDFAKRKYNKKMNKNQAIDSLTFGIIDIELVDKVRKYAFAVEQPMMGKYSLGK